MSEGGGDIGDSPANESDKTRQIFTKWQQLLIAGVSILAFVIQLPNGVGYAIGYGGGMVAMMMVLVLSAKLIRRALRLCARVFNSVVKAVK